MAWWRTQDLCLDALKTRERDASRDAAAAGSAANARTTAEVQAMPAQPELDQLLSQMLEAQGYKDAARQNIMLLTDANKWQLVQSYQQSMLDNAGDIRSQPATASRLYSLVTRQR